MNQLPIFVNMKGRKILLLGEGEAYDAKRRFIERSGAICTDNADEAKIAFVAIEDEEEAIAKADDLKSMGLLVNVVDRPAHCEFTTPAVIDRDPILMAIGTGGASAGLAKAIRQRLEQLLPQNLGDLANGLFAGRTAIKQRWPDASQRRRAIDSALQSGGRLDPFSASSANAVEAWITGGDADYKNRVEVICLTSREADDMTLNMARLLGEADIIYHDDDIDDAVLNRARADAERFSGALKDHPDALVVNLRFCKAWREGSACNPDQCRVKDALKAL